MGYQEFSDLFLSLKDIQTKVLIYLKESPKTKKELHLIINCTKDQLDKIITRNKKNGTITNRYSKKIKQNYYGLNEHILQPKISLENLKKRFEGTLKMENIQKYWNIVEVV